MKTPLLGSRLLLYTVVHHCLQSTHYTTVNQLNFSWTKLDIHPGMIIGESSSQTICPLLWPLSSFNMFSDSSDTWLSCQSSALSYFPRRRQGSTAVSTVWTPGFTSSHLAPRLPSQLVVVCLTLGAASCAGFGPAVLHVEMERVSIVFDAVYNPGERGEEEGSRS